MYILKKLSCTVMFTIFIAFVSFLVTILNAFNYSVSHTQSKRFANWGKKRQLLVNYRLK